MWAWVILKILILITNINNLWTKVLSNPLVQVSDLNSL